MVSMHNAKPNTVDYSRVEMTQVVLPAFTNALGSAFGGNVMAWMDICAAVSAQRHARCQVVTASFDSVNFVEPIRQGHVVIIRTHLNAVFRSSMEIECVVYAETPFTGERRKAVHAYCTFVALDEDGKTKELPKLELHTDEEHKQAKAAHHRRNIRLKNRAMELANQWSED